MPTIIVSNRARCNLFRLVILPLVVLTLTACGGGSDSSSGGGSDTGTDGGSTTASNVGTYVGNVVFSVNVAAVIPVGSDSIRIEVLANGTVRYINQSTSFEAVGTISGNNITVTGNAPVDPRVAASCTPGSYDVTVNAVVENGETITGSLVSSPITCTFEGITGTATLQGNISAEKT